MKAITENTALRKALAIIMIIAMTAALIPVVNGIGAKADPPTSLYSEETGDSALAELNPNENQIVTNGEPKDNGKTDEDKVEFSKIIAQTSNPDEFDITLTVKTYEEITIVTTSNSAEIVLVLDTSGSITNTETGGSEQNFTDLKTAAKDFAKDFLAPDEGTADPNNKLAVVSFADSATVQTGTKNVTSGALVKADKLADIEDSIDDLVSDGSTFTQDGIYKARQILAASKKAREDAATAAGTTADPVPQYIVLFSDGVANGAYTGASISTTGDLLLPDAYKTNSTTTNAVNAQWSSWNDYPNGTTGVNSQRNNESRGPVPTGYAIGDRVTTDNPTQVRAYQSRWRDTSGTDRWQYRTLTSPYQPAVTTPGVNYYVSGFNYNSNYNSNSDRTVPASGSPSATYKGFFVPTVSEAILAKNNGVEIYTVYVGTGTPSTTAADILKGVASSPEYKHYSETTDFTLLAGEFKKISDSIARKANAWKVLDPMTSVVEFVEIKTGQSEDIAKFESGQLTWNIAAEEVTPVGSVYTYTLTYGIKLKDEEIKNGLVGENGKGVPTNGTTILNYYLTEDVGTDAEGRPIITNMRVAEFTVPTVESKPYNYVVRHYTVESAGATPSQVDTTTHTLHWSYVVNVANNQNTYTGYDFSEVKVNGNAISEANYATETVNRLSAFWADDTFKTEGRTAYIDFYYTPHVDEYTVTYEYVGEAPTGAPTATSFNSALTPVGTSVDTASEPGNVTASGVEYYFDGWYEEQALTTAAAASYSNTKILYGRWLVVPKYNVVYSYPAGPAGATPPTGNPFSNINSTATHAVLTPGDVTGYTFDGWYKTYAEGAFSDPVSAGGTVGYADAGSVNGGTVYLYGKWTRNTYTVNYEYTGTIPQVGDVNISAPRSQQYGYGDSYVYPTDLSSAIQNDYDEYDTYHNKTVDYALVWDELTRPVSTVTGNATVIGEWTRTEIEPGTLTVNYAFVYDFNPDGDSYDTISAINALTPADVMNLVNGSPFPKNPTGIVYTDRDYYYTFAWNATPVNPETVTADEDGYTVYGTWTRVAKPTFTVTYVFNEPVPTDLGVTEPAVATYITGSNVVIDTVTDDTLAYEFSGWYTTYTEEAGLTNPAADFNITQNTTLYGAWTAKTFTVEYVYIKQPTGIANPPEDTNTYTYNAEVEIDTTTVNTAVYAFSGWYTTYTEEAGLTNPAADFNITQNTTLYGTWTPIPTYPVKYEYTNADAFPGVLPQLPAAVSYAAGAGVSIDTTVVTFATGAGTYTFSGWKTAANLATATAAENFTMSAAPVTIYGGWTFEPFSPSYRTLTINKAVSYNNATSRPTTGTVFSFGIEVAYVSYPTDPVTGEPIESVGPYDPVVDESGNARIWTTALLADGTVPSIAVDLGELPIEAGYTRLRVTELNANTAMGSSYYTGTTANGVTGKSADLEISEEGYVNGVNASFVNSYSYNTIYFPPDTPEPPEPPVTPPTTTTETPEPTPEPTPEVVIEDEEVAQAAFEQVPEAVEEEIPDEPTALAALQTGDTANTLLMSVIFLAAAAGIVLVLTSGKKKARNKQ